MLTGARDDEAGCLLRVVNWWWRHLHCSFFFGVALLGVCRTRILWIACLCCAWPSLSASSVSLLLHHRGLLSALSLSPACFPPLLLPSFRCHIRCPHLSSFPCFDHSSSPVPVPPSCSPPLCLCFASFSSLALTHPPLIVPFSWHFSAGVSTPSFSTFPAISSYGGHGSWWGKFMKCLEFIIMHKLDSNVDFRAGFCCGLSLGLQQCFCWDIKQHLLLGPPFFRWTKIIAKRVGGRS